jgi:hypothetical protein
MTIFEDAWDWTKKNVGPEDLLLPGITLTSKAAAGAAGAVANAFGGALGLGGGPKPNVTPYRVSSAPGTALGVAGTTAIPQRQMQAAQINAGTYRPGLQLANSSRAMSTGARDTQGQALSLLGGAAAGTAPSAAETLMRQGNDAAIQNQYALANSARGGAAAQMAAQRQAMTGAKQMSQGVVRDTAALRANEMAAARGQYSDAATAMRGSDLSQYGADLNQTGMLANLATQQAGFQQGAGQANLQAGLGADQMRLGQAQNYGQGLLDLERLKMEAQYGPQQIAAQMYAEEQRRKAAMMGGAMNAAGGIFSSLLGG